MDTNLNNILIYNIQFEYTKLMFSSVSLVSSTQNMLLAITRLVRVSSSLLHEHFYRMLALSLRPKQSTYTDRGGEVVVIGVKHDEEQLIYKILCQWRYHDDAQTLQKGKARRLISGAYC